MIRRNTQIRQAGGDDRIDKHPLRVTPGSSPPPIGRLGRAVLRSQFEMGLRRESNSRDGPPPTNVIFDPSLFRRRSEPGRRPKRPAVGQPPGEPSFKRAKGPYYDSNLEAIPKDIIEANVRKAEELQLNLHTLAVELAQVRPGKAVKVFQQQIADLRVVLEQVKTVVERHQRHNAKQQRKPKASSA